MTHPDTPALTETEKARLWDEHVAKLEQENRDEALANEICRILFPDLNIYNNSVASLERWVRVARAARAHIAREGQS